MTRWATAFILALVVTASASAHYGHPDTWFTKDAAAADKIRILQGRVRHADDVTRFFSNHPKPARSQRGRQVLWQHKHMRVWALVRLKDVRRELWFELPDVQDWVTAVRIAQRPYPGSAHFLLRTADDEGGRGPWVPHNSYGDHYYAGYESTDSVGGWMQYRPSTFSGHWRRALEDLSRRGFRVPERLRHASLVESWRSPLAQALAAGWACYRHKTYSHWSASNNGC